MARREGVRGGNTAGARRNNERPKRKSGKKEVRQEKHGAWEKHGRERQSGESRWTCYCFKGPLQKGQSCVGNGKIDGKLSEYRPQRSAEGTRRSWERRERVE